MSQPTNTAAELVDHYIELRDDELAWATKHRTMNKHGRAYHDARAELHTEAARTYSDTILYLEPLMVP